MLSMLIRHAIQVLLAAGVSQEKIREQTGASLRSIRRIAQEPAVADVDQEKARQQRSLGRPSKVEVHREAIEAMLSEDPRLMSLEILRRLRALGYEGGKSALYDFVSGLRASDSSLQMRFEGLPGEFTQHDFGQVEVRYLDGTRETVVFFASRLKYSRWVEVTIVPNQRAETLVRTLHGHFVAFGGIPLLAVFDRPKTIAIAWRKNGEVTQWNSEFAHAVLELGVGVELCWPYQAQQKGSVENLVGWVKGSFFKPRRFRDRDDLLAQLAQWRTEVNELRPSRATGVIPAERLQEERARMRPVKLEPGELGLPVPIQVGPTAHVVHDTHRYSMPAEAAGLPGTLYLYPDRVRIRAGRFEAEHPRLFERNGHSTLAEHRADRLATIAGKRGKRYLKRQDLFELGSIAHEFLTELVHRNPRSWSDDVDALWDALQHAGDDPLRFALHMAVAERRFTAAAVIGHLGLRPAAGEGVLQ